MAPWFIVFFDKVISQHSPKQSFTVNALTETRQQEVWRKLPVPFWQCWKDGLQSDRESENSLRENFRLIMSLRNTFWPIYKEFKAKECPDLKPGNGYWAKQRSLALWNSPVGKETRNETNRIHTARLWKTLRDKILGWIERMMDIRWVVRKSSLKGNIRRLPNSSECEGTCHASLTTFKPQNPTWKEGNNPINLLSNLYMRATTHMYPHTDIYHMHTETHTITVF